MDDDIIGLLDTEYEDESLIETIDCLTALREVAPAGYKTLCQENTYD